MLRISQIETLGKTLRQRYACRNLSEEQFDLFENSLKVNDLRKKAQLELDNANAQSKVIAGQINELYKSGKKEEAEAQRKEVHDQKERIKELEHSFKGYTEKLKNILLHLPNIPHASVPHGRTEEDNEVVKNWGKALPDLGASAVAHWDLAKRFDIIDFSTATKIAGSGFALYKGKGARLQRGLIHFFLDQATEAGYTEYLPPYIVNEQSAEATGQLPDKEGQMYHLTDDNLFLIPTAEVPLTNIYRDEIVDKDDLPIKLTGHTPCFRREAGSYGSDVKGLNRVHQFDKVEIVQIVEPKNSYDVLQEMVDFVESILVKLELPYRLLRLCGGDLGFTSALTFDFEVYAAGQKKWLEVSSISNCETFQSNRLKLRFNGEDGHMHLAHTLNGSALALARIYAALLENNHHDGLVKLPKALVPYTGFDTIS